MMQHLHSCKNYWLLIYLVNKQPRGTTFTSSRIKLWLVVKGEELESKSTTKLSEPKQREYTTEVGYIFRFLAYTVEVTG